MDSFAIQHTPRALQVFVLAVFAVMGCQTQAERTGSVTPVDATASQVAQPRNFSAGASYSLCFVPDGPSCEAMLVDTIDHSQTSLQIQAYSFTSKPIAEAVLNAHKRGVVVQVIVDKSQVSERYTSATFLQHAGIPVVIDTKPKIAHNKVMIFDQTAVFTGSFNFSKSAQNNNAENGIIMRGDPILIKAYLNNWETRFRLSKPYDGPTLKNQSNNSQENNPDD